MQHSMRFMSAGTSNARTTRPKSNQPQSELGIVDIKYQPVQTSSSGLGLLTHTLFINLDSRTDRLAQITRQLHSIGIHNPERVAAIQTDDGAVGCGMSHARCIEIARQRNWPHVFICEDDFKCVDPAKLRHSLAQFEQNHIADGMEDWSVVMLGGNNQPPYTKMPGVEYCIQVRMCASLVGYIVRQSEYDILLQNFREGTNRLINNPTRQINAVDMFCCSLQASGRWFLLTPLTVTQQAGYSNLENRVVNYDRLMLDLDKGWLMSPMHAQAVVGGTRQLMKLI